jgi:elongation factor Ts
MSNISAGMVKELREKTGAGMMDCKKALVESKGDFDGAVDYLRKSGIAKAEKKSSRAVKEGKIISIVEHGKGVLVEVLCETDFVAKNEKFGNFIQEVAGRVFAAGGNGDVSEAVQESEKDTLTSMVATIGENMQIRRSVCWENANGAIASYLHMGGRIGVLVDVEGEDDQEFLNDLCMHIAAFKPDFVDSDSIPAEAIAKEKEIAAAQMANKPADIIEKIVGGKINKWYSEVCLVNQPWIKDDKTSIAKLKPNAKIKRFIRWEIGEEL